MINSGSFVLFELSGKLQFPKRRDKQSSVSGLLFLTLEESWCLKGFGIVNVSIALQLNLQSKVSI